MRKVWELVYPVIEGAAEPDEGQLPSREFAPADTSDGRELGEWKTRYPAEVHPAITAEAIYLSIHGFSFLVLAGIGWGIANRDITLVPVYVGFALVAFAGGGLGGTVFGLKWLYHSVAKALWNLDRRFWRLFTPWISAVLAIAVTSLVAGDVVSFLDPAASRLPSSVFGLSFLVGYFSDITIGKLAEVAQALFGKRLEDTKPSRQIGGQGDAKH